ncbi:MAG: DUF420 domain-containing protein [Candidatus Omnitrophica bacterium]|nr:DUF420 domain-containing protein [Candidatus Omnitrophota bacterium]
MLDTPALNASLNATSALLLVGGVTAIRAGRRALHATCMIGAAAVSVVFLVSYVLYHLQVGSVRFLGTGWIRPAYFSLLISHTILAVVVAPMAARTLWLALRGRFDGHRRMARRTLPVWLYVCASGIVVYWLLYRSVWSRAS